MTRIRITRPRVRQAAEITFETRHADRPLLPVAEIFAWRP
jgi:hypothetical protein